MFAWTVLGRGAYGPHKNVLWPTGQQKCWYQSDRLNLHGEILETIQQHAIELCSHLDQIRDVATLFYRTSCIVVGWQMGNCPWHIDAPACVYVGVMKTFPGMPIPCKRIHHRVPLASRNVYFRVLTLHVKASHLSTHYTQEHA